MRRVIFAVRCWLQSADRYRRVSNNWFDNMSQHCLDTCSVHWSWGCAGFSQLNTQQLWNEDIGKYYFLRLIHSAAKPSHKEAIAWTSLSHTFWRTRVSDSLPLFFSEWVVKQQRHSYRWNSPICSLLSSLLMTASSLSHSEPQSQIWEAITL